MSRTVLVVDDAADLREAFREALEEAGYRVVLAADGGEALVACRKEGPDLVALDVKLPDRDGLEVLSDLRSLCPGTPVIMITGYAAVENAVKALRLGAYDYLEKPVPMDRLLHSIENALEASVLRSEVERRSREEAETYAIDRIIGRSRGIRELRELVHRVATSEAATVLVQGESGTGKELVARALHFDSRRRARAFTALNCAAVPETLLESELFGHEAGAFTGAGRMRKGLFELSDGGTVFFDEIGELAGGMQAKLLRVLEERRFRRVGGVRDLEVDVRVICASNQDLETKTAAGGFREDLYYRLSAIPIRIPPLRDREKDVLLLAEHFIDEYNRKFAKPISGLSDEARQILEVYPWPGNVRELRNAVERAMILRDQGRIRVEDLPLKISGFSEPALGPAGLPGGGDFPAEGIDLARVEETLLRKALKHSGGNQSRAARLLSISRDQLRYRLKKYGI